MNIKQFICMLLLFCVINLNNVNAQNIKYVHKVVKDLCEPTMRGRSILNGGDSIAAKYISKEFANYNLKAFSNGYFQQFNFKSPLRYIENVTLELGEKNNTKKFEDEYSVPIFSASADIEIINEKPIFIDGNKHWELIKNTKLDAIILVFNNKQGVPEFDDNDFQNFHPKLIICQGFDKLPAEIKYKGEKKDIPIITLKDEPIGNTINYMRLIIQSKRIDAHTSRNVIGYVEGKDKNNFIVLTAHYDGIGQIGKYIFPCANRNAIGVATLLDLAAYFSKSENKPRYSILFIASSDGTNLAGFNYYVENPAVALDKMKLMINLEALGTGSQGLVVINGTKQKQMFQFLEKISNDEKYFHKILTKIGDDNDACAVFDKKNIPSISINSIGCEHNYINSTYDNYENLPFTKYESLFKLLRDFIVLYR